MSNSNRRSNSNGNGNNNRNGYSTSNSICNRTSHSATVDDINHYLKALRTLKYGNYGIFLKG